MFSKGESEVQAATISLENTTRMYSPLISNIRRGVEILLTLLRGERVPLLGFLRVPPSVVEVCPGVENDLKRIEREL
jgi:hypothetical protein